MSIVRFDNEAIKSLNSLRLFWILLQLLAKVSRYSPPTAGDEMVLAKQKLQCYLVVAQVKLISLMICCSPAWSGTLLSS